MTDDTELTRVTATAVATSEELTAARLADWPKGALEPLVRRHDMLWRWVHELRAG